MRKTKIVTTIGPSSDKREIISQMIQAGMDVARLNFSHGDHFYYSEIIRTIREESFKLGKPVAILQDLQGSKLRINNINGREIKLTEGEVVEIIPGDGVSTSKTFFVPYKNLIHEVKEGDEILIDDGLIRLEITQKLTDKVLGIVKEGGVLKPKKGINFPNLNATLSFTDKDKTDLLFGINLDVDYIAISFVKNKDDLVSIKEWASQKGLILPPVIAKIERKEAIENIEEILDVADGIMVARGDLGVSLPIHEVPVYQKKLIELANQKCKIVITATQMLESMREHSRPTRAEATDVANAVIDGTDALMLSAETATGRYPVEAVKTMSSIIKFTEKNLSHRIPVLYKVGSSFSEAIASGAVKVAQNINAKAIVVFTEFASTTRVFSKLRPPMPVIAFSIKEKTYRKLSLFWGIIPIWNKNFSLKEIEETLKNLGIANSSDKIVIVSGQSNTIKLHKIG
ncbi:pyruvate kinase [Thermodesulfovibrio sp. TK110]